MGWARRVAPLLIVASVLAAEAGEPTPGAADSGEEKPRPASRSSNGFASAEEMARWAEERREAEEELARLRARGDEVGLLARLLRDAVIDLGAPAARSLEIAEALRGQDYPILALAFDDSNLDAFLDQLKRPWLDCHPARGNVTWKRFTRGIYRELDRAMTEPDPRWQEGAMRRLAMEGTRMFVHVAEEVAEGRAFVAGGCDARYREMPDPVL